MTTPPLQSPALEGRQGLDKAARMQRQIYQAWRRQGGVGGRRHRLVMGPVDVILLVCLTVVLAAIGVGLDRMYPVVRPSLGHALYDDLPVRPYPDCADAHEANVFDIPAGTAAYTIDQDPDRDGLACERV